VGCNTVQGSIDPSLVEGWGKYAGATGGMQVSGTAGYYLNDPKSRANLHTTGLSAWARPPNDGHRTPPPRETEGSGAGDGRRRSAFAFVSST
jgi:hypothetical protein